MEGAGAVFFIFLIILAIPVIWMVTHNLDRNRITDYVQQRGGRIVSINWAPFGKGWFGEKEERIYEVVYYDNTGNQHFATCKTNMWTGVFWTEDRVTHGKSGWYDSLSPTNEPGKPIIRQIPQEPRNDDGDELQRLRAENARLKKQLSEDEASGPADDPEKCPACGARIAPDVDFCPECRIRLQ